MVEQYYKLKLRTFYPDKIVHNLSHNNKLYKELTEASQKSKITLKSYLDQLGFDYTGEDTEDLEANNNEEYEKSKEISEQLDALYPEKIIYKLKKQNNLLYSKILEEASNKELSINEYLTLLGFFNFEDDEFINSLDEEELKSYKTYASNCLSSIPSYLPVDIDKEIFRLITHFKNLGVTLEQCQLITPLEEAVRNRIVKEGISLKEYFSRNEYIAPKTWNAPTIIDQLLNIYPDKKIVDISSNNALYKRVYRHAKKLDITVEEYLSNLGFNTNMKSSNIKKGANIAPPKIDINKIEKLLIEGLEEAYPDKIINNLSDNNDLYDLYLIVLYTKFYNLSYVEFFEKYGYTVRKL